MNIKIFIITCLTFICLAGNGQEIRKARITELASMIDSSDHPLIVNFFATWCVPCIEELPYFRKMAARYKADSVELVLVSLDMKDDYQQKLAAFIRKRKVTNKVIWLDEHDADYFCPIVDPDWSGSIPASLFINRKKNYRRFFERKLTEQQLETEIRDML